MKSSVVLSALVAGIAIIVVAMLAKPRSTTQQGSTAPETNAAAAVQPAIAGTPPSRSNAQKPTASSNSEAEIEQAIQEIDKIFVDGGEEALPKVVSKLSHPEKRVRFAAVETIVKLDDRAAIPNLQQAAQAALDNDEKTNIQAAIDFLSLTSYSELVDKGTLPQPNKIPADKVKASREAEARNLQNLKAAVSGKR